MYYRLGLNSLRLPSSEPVQSALQNESQTVVPSTSNEPVYSATRIHSVVTENSLTVQEETYDRLKHNHSSYDHIGSGNIDKGSNEEYSRIAGGIKTVYNTLESVMHLCDDNNEVCDSLEHDGSGNNHIGSCEYSTVTGTESRVDDVLENKMTLNVIFDDPNYVSMS